MLTTSRLQIDRLVLTFRKNIRMDILEIISKGLVPFTQLVKVRRITWFWHFQASDFHENFTRSSQTLNMSKKTSFGTITCHSWQDNGKKTPFFMEKWPIFFTFLIDCDHIYIPNGMIWGSTSRPHIGGVVMSLYFCSGVDRFGMAQKWSILDQKWPKIAGLSTLQTGPKGSKRDQNG